MDVSKVDVKGFPIPGNSSIFRELPARDAPKGQNKHVQIRTPTPLSVSSEQEQTYTNSRPVVEDTPAGGSIGSGGCKFGWVWSQLTFGWRRKASTTADSRRKPRFFFRRKPEKLQIRVPHHQCGPKHVHESVIGCTRRGSYSANGRASAFLSTFYKRSLL